MEIMFKNKDNARPVYDFEIKQEWEKHVYYECPAKLTEAEQKAIEKIARETFWALDCRDVARVDLRMDAEGRIYVLEVNPLPGLTPGLLGPRADREGGRHGVRPADRRDHGRRAAPAAREAARGARARARARGAGGEGREGGRGREAAEQAERGDKAEKRPRRQAKADGNGTATATAATATATATSGPSQQVAASRATAGGNGNGTAPRRCGASDDAEPQTRVDGGTARRPTPTAGSAASAR